MNYKVTYFILFPLDPIIKECKKDCKDFLLGRVAVFPLQNSAAHSHRAIRYIFFLQKKDAASIPHALGNTIAFITRCHSERSDHRERSEESLLSFRRPQGGRISSYKMHI